MKNKISILLILFSVALCFVCSRCKEPKEKPRKFLGTYRLTEVLPYLYFKKGSFWVYECDSTKQIDTQVMTRIDTLWYDLGYIKYQLLSYAKISKNVRGSYDPFSFGDIKSYCETCNNSFFANFLSISGERGYGTHCVFFYPFDTTLNSGGGGGGTKYVGFLPSLDVLGKTYNSVHVFKVLITDGWVLPNTWRKDQLSYAARVEYFWAKNVGLIKIRVAVNDLALKESFIFSWNLKSYHHK